MYGDVNSTAAAALVAVKLGQRVAHVEAGVRSNDRSMPEEINRIVVDRLADLLLTPSRTADATLRAEGEPATEIAFVGNVMVDALLFAVERARVTGARKRVGVRERKRRRGDAAPAGERGQPDPSRRRSCGALRAIAADRPVLLPGAPAHARHGSTRPGLDVGQVQLMAPVGYLEMLDLMDAAHAVVTDSGGLAGGERGARRALSDRARIRPSGRRRSRAARTGSSSIPSGLPAAVVVGSPASAQPPRPEGWDGMAAVRVVDCLRTR